MTPSLELSLDPELGLCVWAKVREKSEGSFTSYLYFSNWTVFMRNWNIKKKTSVLQHLLRSLSYSNVSRIVFKKERWARSWCAETAVMKCNFVHTAREETPTERLWNPSLSVAAASSLGERGGCSVDAVISSIWSSMQRYTAYKPPDQSDTANTETTTLFISKPAARGTGGLIR